jgi:hypothetical protein
MHPDLLMVGPEDLKAWTASGDVVKALFVGTKDEADRAAAEQAAKDEADRAAAEQAAKDEADRVAAEQAAKADADRAAAEQAAKDGKTEAATTARTSKTRKSS